MKHEAYYTCDLGGERYADRGSLRNDVSLINGENSAIFADVCDKHLAEIMELINQRFPKNVRRKGED